MRPRSLDTFLKKARVPYTAFSHPPAFRAQDEAAISHVPGRSWAKIVVCFADEQPILAVLPASRMIALERLRLLAGASVLRLAAEQEFLELYPDCEVGAMLPFGSLYLQRVFVDHSLVGEAEMVFNAGTHTDAIRMHFLDFVELANPVVGEFGCEPSSKAAAVRICRSPDTPEAV